MRTCSIHDALAPGSMSFDGFGEFIGRRDEPVGFTEVLSRVAKALKIGNKEQRRLTSGPPVSGKLSPPPKCKNQTGDWNLDPVVRLNPEWSAWPLETIAAA